MAGFVQIVEWRTSRIDEVDALHEEWSARDPDVGPTRVLVAGDREDQGRYLTVVEFDSYEEAMKNSADPGTRELAARMAELCDAPATFWNLDVRHLAEH